MAASSNSMEVGVLGSANESWTQWILGDTARAELPLGANKQETLPVGVALDTGTTKPFPWGESTLPPAPYIYMFSNHGVLCCFNVVNIREGAKPICEAPEQLAGSDTFKFFTRESTSEEAAPVPVPTVAQVVKTVPVSTIQHQVCIC